MDMEVHKDDQAHPIYIAGGKGISTDPYIVVDGVKQSWERTVLYSWKL